MPSPVTNIWHQREAVDPAGHDVGRVEDLYIDQTSGDPAFLLVGGGLFGIHKHFVPVEGASLEGDDKVRLGFDADTIKGAPRISADEQLSVGEEQRLFEYYGIGDRHPGTEVVLVSWTVYSA
jgi:hypothetical protein